MSVSVESLPALFQAALTAHQAGRFEQARAGYEQILASHPLHSDALHLLGLVEREAKRYDKAIALIRRSLAVCAVSDIYHNLGVTCAQANRYDEACDAYREALRLKPDYADAAYALGRLLHQNGDYDAAIAAFRVAVPHPAHAAYALGNVGLCYQEQGDLSAAIACYRQALEKKPDYALGLRQLSGLVTFSDPQDPLIAAMQAAFQPANEEDRIHLAFALGKALDDVRDYAQAFEWYAIGNRLKRKTYVGYSTQKMEVVYQEMLAQFAPDYLKNAPFSTIPGTQKMIFIVGMPRSGTTLVEQILASHTDVFGAGELETFSLLLPPGFPQNVTSYCSDTLNQIAKQYLAKVMLKAPHARRIVDKMPMNYRFLGVMAQVFPEAKFIHCQRDPMDTCLSIYRQCFTGKHPYAYDLQEIGEFYRLYERLMAQWRQMLPKTQFYEIQYEKLVVHQEEESRALLEFCGLTWQDACLNFHQTARCVKTASAAQVRKPIYRSSLTMWEHYGDAIQPLKQALDTFLAS